MNNFRWIPIFISDSTKDIDTKLSICDGILLTDGQITIEDNP